MEDTDKTVHTIAAMPLGINSKLSGVHRLISSLKRRGLLPEGISSQHGERFYFVVYFVT